MWGEDQDRKRERNTARYVGVHTEGAQEVEEGAQGHGFEGEAPGRRWSNQTKGVNESVTGNS